MADGAAAYVLRPCSPGDAEFLYRVFASTREDELATLPWTTEQKEAFLRMQFDAQDRHYRAHYQRASYDLIIVNDVPVGRLYVYRTPREIRVMDVALLPEFRRRGIGERVFRDLFAQADEQGQLVSIHVEYHNVARRLYERLGFHVAEANEETPAYVLMERYAKTA